MWTRKFQQESTTTGNFMTASIIPFQMILVAQIWIYLPLPLMIDHPHKRPRYTPDMLPATISVASEKYFNTLTTPSDSTRLLILPYDNPNSPHVTNKYKTYRGRVKIWHCSGKHDEKYATKIWDCIAPRSLIKTGKFITVMGFPGLIKIWIIDSRSINILRNKGSLDCCVCLPSTLYFTCWTHFCACFIPVPLITPCSNTYVLSVWNFDLILFLLTVLMNDMKDLSDS